MDFETKTTFLDKCRFKGFFMCSLYIEIIFDIILKTRLLKDINMLFE